MKKMKKIKKCNNCQYNINYYIDSVNEIKTENYKCLKCNLQFFDNIEMNNHKKKCKGQFTKVICEYFCSNECKFSYYMRKNEKNINFRNIYYDYPITISNSYECFNRNICIT